LIAFIAVANLRGVRESGALFAGPTYSFLISFLFMVGYGIVQYFFHPVTAQASPEHLKIAEGYGLQPISLFLLLGAFSNGCVALTGTEAISNGLPLQGAATRKRDGDFAVCAHHFHGADGLVLLRDPGNDGFDFGPRRKHF